MGLRCGVTIGLRGTLILVHVRCVLMGVLISILQIALLDLLLTGVASTIAVDLVSGVLVVTVLFAVLIIAGITVWHAFVIKR